MIENSPRLIVANHRLIRKRRNLLVFCSLNLTREPEKDGGRSGKREREREFVSGHSGRINNM